ncbi:AMP-binding protein [Amycolatopsis jejuensis]|uniref:AMP-binding protein n=1 Tax=Amycolatopsis jejuensis TaxID=330084 RepID=UPI000524D2D4|nr:AMP-binding protein [Amycolatopsis jejuensis]
MSDPRRSSEIVFRYLLEAHARDHGDRQFAVFPEENAAWTWADADRAANRCAAVLRAHGVGRGDRVAVLGDNTQGVVQTLLGTTKLGGVYSPLHPAWQADHLRHGLSVTKPKFLVCQADYLPRLEAAESPDLPPTVGVLGEFTPRGSRFVAMNELIEAAPADPPDDPGLHIWDPYAAIFTSGTTGPPKAVLSPYGQLAAQIEHSMLPFLDADEVLLGDMPLYHVGALLSFLAVLQLGARWVVVPKVRIDSFWDTVRRYGVTHATFTPAAATFLEKKQPRPDDADNPLRIVLTGTFSKGLDRWCARFGVPHRYRYYNGTEQCSPLMTGLDPAEDAPTGYVRPGVTARLVDGDDLPVPPGAVGELVVRPDRPWETMLGYLGDPAATARAWRNGWYHTGDLFVQTGEGTFQHVDRAADVIRRHGENISSVEVERVVLEHPAVLRGAAVGLPSEEVPGDQDIKLCLVLRPDADLAMDELIGFLRDRLPSYAVPRYVEICPELPVTATNKIRKPVLRAAGVTAATWDRHRPQGSRTG